MKTVIFYCTGTGNSLWTARKISEKLGQTELVHMADFMKDPKSIRLDVAGLVFPVYIWGVPGPVVRFVETCKSVGADYWFAVAVNGGQVSNTLVQIKSLMRKNGLLLSAGFDIKTPSNYIPWGGPPPKDKQDKLFEAAQEKISNLTEQVKSGKSSPMEKGPLWQRALFTPMYKMSFPHVHEMDGKFWTDEKCDHCGICAKVCPAENITMSDGKPVWNHRCEQCLACIQWCPKEAIQYGKKTPKYQRYRNPEIALKDVLRRKA